MNKKGMYEIYDNKLKKVIVRDNIVFEKAIPKWCISFDDKYFFNSESKRFKIKKVVDKDIIPYDQSIINNYDVELWIKSEEIQSDVYKDYTIDELDPEVEPLVKALNTIDGIKTTGSCCGHNQSELWVAMLCYNFESLIFLVNTIADDPMFAENFNVFVKKSSDKIDKNPNNIFVTLRTNNKIIGDKAYKIARRLSQLIKQKNMYSIVED